MEENDPKRFDLWNTQKKKLHERMLPDDFFFLEGEVWWAALGVNIGHEIDGKNDLYERPILIMKKINDEMLLAIPMTSSAKYEKDAYKISYKGFEYALLFGQTRSISISRLLRLVRRLKDEEFKLIRDQLCSIFYSIKTIPSG